MAALLPALQGWRPGDFLYVHYQADPEFYHERMLLAEITPLKWIIATPDGDVYPMDLSIPPLLAIRACPPGGNRTLPVGYHRNDCYTFEDGDIGVPTPLMRQQLIDDAGAHANQLHAVEGLPPIGAAPPPLAAPPPAPGLPPAGPVALAPGGPPAAGPAGPPGPVLPLAVAAPAAVANPAHPWVIDDFVANFDIGDVIPLPIDAVIHGRRALGTVGPGGPSVLYHLDGTEISDQFRERREREFSGDDARTLALRLARDGRRHRDFREAVEMLEEVDMTDFPLAGPRVAHWSLTAMASSTAGPMARHHRWVQEARIPSSDRSIYEHEVISRFIEFALCYDGLALDNLACAELLLRRMQLIEHGHLDDPSSPNWEGARHFMGTGERRGGAIVAPALEQFVAENLRGEAAIAKERRKARESRTFQALRGEAQGGRGRGRGRGRGGDAPAAGAAAT